MFEALDKESKNGKPRKVFDLGCGNGAVASSLHQRGYEVVGVDPSSEGIALAIKSVSELEASAWFCLRRTHVHLRPVSNRDKFGSRRAPLLTENVRAHALLVASGRRPGGGFHAIPRIPQKPGACSRRRHGQSLHRALKSWAYKVLVDEALRTLLEEAGFRSIEFRRVGRVPVLAKSMIAFARK